MGKGGVIAASRWYSATTMECRLNSTPGVGTGWLRERCIEPRVKGADSDRVGAG